MILQIVIALILFSIDFSVVMADVNYIYKGNNFNLVGGNYTTSLKITGSITLPMPLPPNQTYSGIKLPVFSFSDGINKLNDKNTSRYNYHLETDSKGNIKNWSIHFDRYEPNPPKVFGVVKGISTLKVDNSQSLYSRDSGYIGICLETMDDYCSSAYWGNYNYGFRDNNAGTWKITNDTGSPSRKTGLNISKSIELVRYASDLAISRLPTYYYIAQYLTATCPVFVLSCAELAAEIAGVALVEGFQVGKIIKDPPDQLYSEIFQPRQYQAFTLDSSSGFSQELIDAANAAFRDRAELASLLEAWRVTLERYSAAQAANDQSNMLRQAAALDDYIIQTSRLATLVQQSFGEFLDQLEIETGSVLISPDQMQDEMNNLAVNGFSQSVLDRLSSFGLGAAEIEELRSTLLQAPPLSGTVDFYSSMRSTEGSYGDLSALTRYVAENNQLPAAQCHDVTVSANGSCQANANIDNGSHDPDDDPITLTQTPAGPYGLGSTGVTLTATDSNGASASCSATVTVVDTTPPTITSVTANPNTLWPPNHKMVPVTVSATTSDNCTAAPVCKITSVASSEPVNGTGDGDTAPDWQITGNLTVNLRAERAGNGSGRVYTIAVQCADASNNNSSQTVTVTVPHNQ